jgi:hypothetical protein
MYAQFGCGALAASIQVSAHPVAPSFGITDPIGKWCPMSCRTWYGQLAPTVTSPLANADICAGALLQYCFTSGCWPLSRFTAAWNCGWVSSYGSVMPSEGSWALRYSAASAM